MVSIDKRLTLLFFTLLTGCVTQQPVEKKPEPTHEDIYAPIKHNVIEYRDKKEEKVISTATTDYLDTQIKQVRQLFFNEKYDQASQLAERLVRQEPNNPNTYYWLARIRLEMSDYNQAYQMTEKGLSVSQKDSAIRKSLERLHQQAGLGIH